MMGQLSRDRTSRSNDRNDRNDRNLVLVTVDSLRADHYGFLNGTDATLTPVLDGMANEGVAFENAIAPGPRTPSSMPEIFTGEPLQPPGAGADYWDRWRGTIRRHMARYRSVARRLQDRRYATVGVTVNPWTHDTGFDAGFDRFVEITGDTLGSYGSPAFGAVDRLLRGNGVGDAIKWYNKREWFIRWTDFYDRIVDALDAVAEPYFLWVFLLDTHQPYIAPRAYRTESSALGMYYASFTELRSPGEAIPGHVETRLRRAYRDAVRSIDGFLGRFRRDRAGDDPVIVVHADHGEAFGEHGTYGHERELYRENVHVPLVVHNAGVEGVVREPFSLRRLPHLIETVADGRRFDPAAMTVPFVISKTDEGEKTATNGRTWRYIRGADSEELYHLGDDPFERANLAARYPAVAAALRSLTERHRWYRSERDHITETTEALRVGL